MTEYGKAACGEVKERIEKLLSEIEEVRKELEGRTINRDRETQLEAHLRRCQIQTNRHEKNYERIKKALD